MNIYKDKENYVTVKPEPSLWKYHANYYIMHDIKHLFKNAICADLGCNHGACTLLLHEFNPLQVDGYDINRDALTVAQTSALEIGVLDKTNFIETNLTDIPVQDSQYDVITSFHTLEHIYGFDVDNVVKEMYRILKPNGHILISIPYKTNYPDTCHVAFYDEISLKFLFEKHNFITLRCFEDNRWEQKGLLTALFQKV
jgi:2-polyprenyl-3-methyl-5-hydroxy-6-metoxy-1,4-benzoquinol methylase